MLLGPSSGAGHASSYPASSSYAAGPAGSASSATMLTASAAPSFPARVGEPLQAQRKRIQDLVASVAGPDSARLEPEVEQLLLDLADDFVEDVGHFAAMLARHRKSETIEPRDILMHLEKHWQLRIPGFSPPEAAMSSAPLTTGPSLPSTLASTVRTHVRSIFPPAHGIGEAHRKRLALIAKAKAREARKTQAKAQANQANAAAAATNAPAAAAVPMEDTNGTAKAAGGAAAKKRKRGPNDE